MFKNLLQGRERKFSKSGLKSHIQKRGKVVMGNSFAFVQIIQKQITKFGIYSENVDRVLLF